MELPIINKKDVLGKGQGGAQKDVFGKDPMDLGQPDSVDPFANKPKLMNEEV